MIFKNTKLKSLITVFGILFIFTSLRFLWLTYHFSSNQPVAREGVLDLRNYKLQDDKTIILNGEWQYVSDKLLETDELNKIRWEKASVPLNQDDDSASRYGTYRLKIILDENQVANQTFGIRVPSVKTASALWVNGELKGKSGEVADNFKQHKGKDVPYIAYFTTNQQEVDVVLYVSNFDTPENIGINKSIKFGFMSSVLKEQSQSKILVTSIVVVLLLHSLYSLLIYFFIYRNKIVLFFTAGFIFPALDEIITYDKSLMDWMQLDYHWSLKVFTLIYLAASFFYVQFMRVLLTNYQNFKIFRWFAILYGVCAILIILMPTHYLLPANALFFALYFISFVSVIILALKEFFQNEKESFFLAFVALSTTSGIVWGLIKAFTKIEIPFYPFDYLFAFLGFAAFWFKRFDKKNKEATELVLQLQKEDKLKDKFLVNSAEKIWTPLNEMITIAQIIIDRKKSSLTHQDEEDLKFLINVGRMLFFTLNDLVDFTRLKEGKVQIQLKSISIHGAVSGVFDMLRFFSDGKQIEMKCNIPPNFPNVMADEERLVQILFNLLHNAIKFTNVGDIILEAEIKNNMAVIHVYDNGIGMDEEVKNKAFSSYEQGIENDKGIGIGLNVCKHLIELHGGTLKFKSFLNQGSNFFFTLPLADDEVTKESVEETRLDGDDNAEVKRNNVSEQVMIENQKQYEILVVDDDPVSAKVISDIFRSEQYKVTTVMNANKVMQLLDYVEWDLIIIDAMMPYISGYELTRLIREHYTQLELPILLITSRNYPQDVYTGFSFGVNDYVVRPINSLELKIRGQALINFKHSINERLYMEAAWLQAQIQPHFLYNTLNTIASFSIIDPERMVALLNKFGEYLRRSFDSKNLQRTVPLENEMNLVRSYLYIEKERFGERLQIEWEIDENIVVEIPPLSIQPLVENAIHHGIIKKREGGTLWIKIKDYPNYRLISVRDDGVGIEEEKVTEILEGTNQRSGGVGVSNTNRRLKRIYGQGLQIKSVLNQGTEVSFEIPKGK